MAKISLLLFSVALIAFLHVYEARHVANVGEAFGQDLKAKKVNIQGFASEVKSMSKSKVTLNDLRNAYKKDMDLRPYEKKLKTFSRATTVKNAPPAKDKKPVSIIQSILKDFGLNGGRK